MEFFQFCSFLPKFGLLASLVTSNKGIEISTKFRLLKPLLNWEHFLQTLRLRTSRRAHKKQSAFYRQVLDLSLAAVRG
jgi:hypothetical protein